MPNGDSTYRHELLNVNIDKQKETLSFISTIITKLGDVVPEPEAQIVIKVVGYAVQLLSIFSPDPDEQLAYAIETLAKTFHDGFIFLEATESANIMLTRATFLADKLQKATDALNNLRVAVDIPGFFSPGDLISDCQDAIGYFLHDTITLAWYLQYSTNVFRGIYWDDSDQMSVCYGWSGADPDNPIANIDRACFGAQYPPIHDETTVFDYRVSLPAFLAAITALLIVGRTFPKEFSEWTGKSEYLTEVLEKLQWVYEKIMKEGEGLTPLTPPNWTEIDGWLEGTACPFEDGYFLSPRPPIVLDYSYAPDKMPYPKSATIRYGAVERFSGASSIGEAIVTDINKADIAVFRKLQIRTLKRTKDLYVTLGLPAVWQMINHLKALAGDQSTPEPEFSTWSVREAFQVAKLEPVNGCYSLRTLADFLVKTQPYDTPYDPDSPNNTLSFRQLINDTP